MALSPVPSPLPTPGDLLPVDGTTLPADVTHAATQGAALLSHWVPALPGLALLAFVTSWVLRVRQRRRDGEPRPPHRVLRSAGAGLGCLLLAVLTVAAAVNIRAGYLPTVDSAVRFVLSDHSARAPSDATTVSAVSGTPGGAVAVAAHDTAWHVDGLVLPDPALRIGRRQVIVATPPGYTTSGQDYPVLYLFGGYPGRANDWFETARITRMLDQLVAHHLAPFFVLIAPDINGGYLTDSEGLDAVGGPQVETWITRDVPAYVSTHYRVRTDRGNQVFAGMSSGAFAALNLALRHTDQVGIALALEPYGDPGNVTRRLLRGDVSLLHANSPQYYLARMPLHRLLHVYLDVGSATGEVGRVTSLERLLHARGESVLLRQEAGQDHTWSEAVAGMPYAMAFAAAHLGDPALAQSFPASAFPTTHRDRYSLLPEDDAQEQRQRRDGVAPGQAGRPPLVRQCAPTSAPAGRGSRRAAAAAPSCALSRA